MLGSWSGDASAVSGCGTQSNRAIKHQQNECRAATAAPSSFRPWALALANARIDAADGTSCMVTEVASYTSDESLGPDVLVASSREFAPNVDVRTRGQLLGALGNTGSVELLGLTLAGTSYELRVSLQGLFKQAGSLSPNVQALRNLRLRTTPATEVAEAKKACRVSRYCGHVLCWGRHCAASSFLRTLTWNLSKGSARCEFENSTEKGRGRRHVPISLHDHEPNPCPPPLRTSTPPRPAGHGTQVVRFKYEQYGDRLVGYLEPHAMLRNSEWDVDSYVSCSPSFHLGAVSRAAETEWNGSVARLARKYSACTSAPFIQSLGEGWRQTTTHHFYEHEHELLFPRPATTHILLTIWRGPSQVGNIKHEHNVGLVGNLAQLVDVVPSRLLFHHVALDRDTANRMSRMAVDDVSHASDESVGSDAIIASSCRGSRG
ncbi:hypothetical protein EDB83DRAFT_2552026 [Lactarius deliciosus]|nr:hypothetical protein EDB83DRAFT_2552026 [Lactarius deliciosus]